MSYLMIFLEILGTISFSISGAIEAMKKRMDILGVIVLGLVTATGGGICRDILIGHFPPEVFNSLRNVILALVAALVAFIIGAVLSKNKKELHKNVWNQALLLSDALGLGAFTVLGTRFVEEQVGSENVVLLVCVGVITGVGGGVMRDLFAGNIPYIFRKHIYATASIAGSVIYLIISKICNSDMAAAISLTFILLIRIFAAKNRWNLPTVNLDENE